MRRDLSLYRSILLAMEDSSRPLTSHDLADESHDEQTVAAHILLMADDGLIDAITSTSGSRVDLAQITRIRGRGYDYLDAVRDPSVWSKVKLAVAKTVGSVGIDAVKALATEVAVSIAKGAIR